MLRRFNRWVPARARRIRWNLGGVPEQGTRTIHAVHEFAVRQRHEQRKDASQVHDEQPAHERTVAQQHEHQSRQARQEQQDQERVVQAFPGRIREVWIATTLE